MKRILRCSIMLVAIVFVNVPSVCLAVEMKGATGGATGATTGATGGTGSAAGGSGGSTFGSKAVTPGGNPCDQSIFGIPPWYHGMMNSGSSGCEFTPITYSDGGKDKTDFVKTGAKVISNVIQAGLVIVAYVTIGFLIRGGFGYLTSTGSPDGMAVAKKTITNALIGMIISLLAASIVNAIGEAIK